MEFLPEGFSGERYSQPKYFKKISKTIKEKELSKKTRLLKYDIKQQHYENTIKQIVSLKNELIYNKESIDKYNNDLKNANEEEKEDILENIENIKEQSKLIYNLLIDKEESIKNLKKQKINILARGVEDNLRDEELYKSKELIKNIMDSYLKSLGSIKEIKGGKYSYIDITGEEEIIEGKDLKEVIEKINSKVDELLSYYDKYIQQREVEFPSPGELKRVINIKNGLIKANKIALGLGLYIITTFATIDYFLKKYKKNK